MRFEVIQAVYECGLENKNLYFIQGDLGHMKTEEFRRDFGSRYMNGGMAEQNILSVAGGLGLSGKQVVVYSIAPFITSRCMEQIKLDVCHHGTNVIIVGVGGGFAYGSAGATHYTIEELAAFRAMPNLKIVCPADPLEAYTLTKELLNLGGPAYLRIGRGKEPNLPVAHEVAFGKAVSLRPGKQGVIFSQGAIVSEALRAAEILAGQGIELEVVNIHTLKPLDVDGILARADREGVFTLEEHNIYGGLGGAVAEVLMEAAVRPRVFRRFGIPDRWPELVGSQQYLRDQMGISAEKVAAAIAAVLGR